VHGFFIFYFEKLQYIEFGLSVIRMGKCKMEISIERADVADAEQLIDAQNKSFYEDYQKYGHSNTIRRTRQSGRREMESDHTA